MRERLKIELTNKTRFRGDDLRALLRATLKAVGYRATRLPLKVEVVSSRTRISSGEAVVGTSPRLPGLWMKLRIPPKARWTPDEWRRVVAVTIHECLHLVGSEHRDMTEAQLYGTLPLPAWAAGLQLREQEEQPKPNRVEQRVLRASAGLQHARAMLKSADGKARRWVKIKEKWEQEVRSLERRVGGVMSPVEGFLLLGGWHGKSEQLVLVVDVTPKKYRIRALSLTRLAGRGRSLEVGQETLVPKTAIRLSQKSV